MGQLYIRDESVNDLAERVMALSGKNKTEAVRAALLHEIERLSERKSLAQRIAPVQERLRALGAKLNDTEERTGCEAVADHQGASDVS